MVLAVIVEIVASIFLIMDAVSFDHALYLTERGFCVNLAAVEPGDVLWIEERYLPPPPPPPPPTGRKPSRGSPPHSPPHPSPTSSTGPPPTSPPHPSPTSSPGPPPTSPPPPPPPPKHSSPPKSPSPPRPPPPPPPKKHHDRHHARRNLAPWDVDRLEDEWNTDDLLKSSFPLGGGYDHEHKHHDDDGHDTSRRRTKWDSNPYEAGYSAHTFDGTLVSNKGTRVVTVIVVTIASICLKIAGYSAGMEGNLCGKFMFGALSAIVDADLLLTNWLFLVDPQTGCITDTFAQYVILLSNWSFLLFPFLPILGIPCIIFFAIKFLEVRMVIRILGVIEMFFDILV